jgi:hypothetical protein
MSRSLLISEDSSSFVSGKREWVRIFDTAGRSLNANDPHAGLSTPSRMKKLGLESYSISKSSVSLLLRLVVRLHCLRLRA